MASLPSFPLLVTFSLLTLASYANGGKVRSHHTISVASLSMPPVVCSSSTAPSNGSLKVVHRHGPCSPLGNHPKLNHEQILQQDHVRVTSLHNRISDAAWRDGVGGSLDGTSIPARRDISLGTLEYVVTIGFGTPKRDLSLIFDTGSDITWIQCEPCLSYCYPQKEPIFDPSQSSTYSPISCGSTACSLTGDQPTCAGDTCLYAVKYGDGSVTAGYFSQETLTLTSSDVITDFKFGCGELNRGYFGSVAGLLGLGRGEASLVSQTSKQINGLFSYCLPPYASSTGYLALGAGALSANIEFTPMLTKSDMPSFYFLGLTGISVGGQSLPIDSKTFTDAGTVIDSGTIITRIPSTAYSALSKAFRSQMSGYPLAPPFYLLDTCYDITGFDNVSVPPVALEFDGGATLDVDASGILYVVNTSLACLAFAANNDTTLPSIIGNMQQRTYNVVYDISNGRMGFGSGACS